MTNKIIYTKHKTILVITRKAHVFTILYIYVCFRNPTAYSFCKILHTHFSKGNCKGSCYTVNIIDKLQGTGRTERNNMDFAAKPLQKARETYWMHELRTIFHMVLMTG